MFLQTNDLLLIMSFIDGHVLVESFQSVQFIFQHGGVRRAFVRGEDVNALSLCRSESSGDDVEE